jgi:hypothetical protein
MNILNDGTDIFAEHRIPLEIKLLKICLITASSLIIQVIV